MKHECPCPECKRLRAGVKDAAERLTIAIAALKKIAGPSPSTEFDGTRAEPVSAMTAAKALDRILF